MAIETKLKYEISDNEITVYSSRVLTMLAVVIGIVCYASVGAVLAMSYSLNGELKMESVYICAILSVPFLIMFLFGNRRVIFSRRDETVYKSYGFGRRELVRFSEIHKIDLVTGTTPSYRIFLKKNMYGKGIKILSPVTPKAMQVFDENIMPALQKMVNISETEKQLVINLDKLKYYNRKGNTFKLIRRFEIGWNIILLGLCAVGINYGISSENTTLLYCMIPPTLIAIGLLTHTRKFDTENGIFTHSIALIWKKSYHLGQFVHFVVVRNSTNGLYTGSDVKLVFLNDKGKEKTVKLLNIRKSAKIEQFMQETKKIMSEKLKEGHALR